MSNGSTISSQTSKRTKQLLLILSKQIINITELKNFCWQGIPSENPKHRAESWKYLLGIYPVNHELIESSIKRKTNEYLDMCNNYSKALANSETIMNEQELAIYRQIMKDVPRTMPEYPMFQNEKIKTMMTRVLYIWSMRHPASGYVQGFNDLTIPFFVVFFLEHFENCTIDKLLMKTIEELQEVISEKSFTLIETDIFYALTKLLDRIQTNYTSKQPGIANMMKNMKMLIQIVDKDLYNHLELMEVDYVQFCFRWMNCFLMREFSIELIIRLWDTYFSEETGFRDFHLYVCACLLLSFSETLKKMKEFQEIIMFLQKLPTITWGENDITILCAKSYQIRETFASLINKGNK